jgi:hypothetical protein
VKFALLSNIGAPAIDILVQEETIREAFSFYLEN